MSVVKTVITGSMVSLLVGAGVSLFLLTIPVSLTVALTWGGLAAVGGGTIYGLGAVMGGIDSEVTKKESEAEQTEIESKKILADKKMDKAQLESMLQKTMVQVSAMRAEVHTLQESVKEHRKETDSYQKVTDNVLLGLQSRPPVLVSSPKPPLSSVTAAGLETMGLFPNPGLTDDASSGQKHKARGCRSGC